MLTEHRAGTYVYNDVLIVSAGAATWDDCAMFDPATVMVAPNGGSRSHRHRESKVLTREQMYCIEGYGRVVESPYWSWPT